MYNTQFYRYLTYKDECCAIYSDMAMPSNFRMSYKYKTTK